MTREEAIERISDHMEVHKIGEYPHIRLAVALNMALDALRAQQPPARLDRSRWEGCDCCKGDLEGYTTQFRDASGRSRPLYIPEGEAMIVAPGKYNHRFCIPIKYCPMCGRPLTKEAWAELERRINGGAVD